MKNFLKKLFNDNNTINEKSFIGFCAFLMMVIFAIADIITGTFGKELVIQEFIFNAFILLTLGSFGIGSIDKFINSKKEDQSENGEL